MPTSGYPAPPHPPKATVPADVPRIGPNTRTGEKPPVEPLEATQHTARGAKAFAAFFIKTIDWGYATTSSTYMHHYFTDACTGCSIFAHAIDAARRAQHHFIGGRFTVTRSTTRSFSSLRANVTVTANNSSFEEVNHHNKFVKGDVAHHGERFALKLVWQGSSWVVVSQFITA